MWRLLVLFVILVLYKLLTNTVRHWQVKRYLAMYERYLKEPTWDMEEAKLKAVALLEGAGVKDQSITTIGMFNPMVLHKGTLSVFTNLTSRREDVASIVGAMFHQALGVYRGRALEALNPLYWVEAVGNLPRNAAGYFGVPVENVLVKVVTVLYRVALVISGAVYALYKPEIDAAIKALISRFIP